MRRGSEPPYGAHGLQPSPEHVADPEHVALPGALPAHGHGGHGLQPHKAPSPLQPAVVTSHHLPLVQHWAQPRGRPRQRQAGGQEDGAREEDGDREGDGREETRAKVQSGRWGETESEGLSTNLARGPSGFLRGAGSERHHGPCPPTPRLSCGSGCRDWGHSGQGC